MPRPRADGRPPREPVRKNLTDMMVRRLAAQAQTFQIYDDKQRGLVLQVQPTGRKAYKVYYSRQGRPRWFHLGAADAIGLADARREAAEIMLRVARGDDPHADRMAHRSAGTFGELVEAYLAECGNKSVAQYEGQLNKWAMRPWRNLPAAGIKRADVRVLFDARKRKSVASAKLLLAAISSVFAWAIAKEFGGVETNPARGIASSRHDKSLRSRARERALSDEEVRSFWHAWEESGLAPCNALRVILLTGQRPGEVRHMRWEDLDEGEHAFERTVGGRTARSTHAGAWWKLPGAPEGRWPGTKNGDAHRVWLTPAVLSLLAEVSGDRREGFVFQTSRGNPVSGLDGAMRDACKALGVADPATPHDLRRTHGTLITRLGFNRDAMNRLQNHREGGIGSVYDRHDYADEARAIQERVRDHVSRLLSGEQDPRIADLDQERVRRR